MRTGVFVIISFALFLGGIILMGYATTWPEWQGVGFIGGILCVALALGLPVHLLKRLD